jgi:hypothetical protein
MRRDFEDVSMTTDTVKQGCIKHAAMAQLHRWYQIYENVDTTLANQLDILASDIKLKSGLGEGVGHEAYSQRINQLPKTWKNAHLVNGSNFKLSADGTIDLDITLTYLNQGMKPDGSIRSAELTYTTKLKPTANVLPQFSQIEIKQLNEGVAPAFKDAYPENRVLSLMHYWLALIEDPKRNLGPFKEILADGFELQFSSDKINDFQAFEKWFRGPASAVAASTHVIDNFSYEVIDKKTWRVQADFTWQGLLPDGKEMVTKTRHRWTVIDNPQERFARIKTATVEVLEPFQPKK